MPAFLTGVGLEKRRLEIPEEEDEDIRPEDLPALAYLEPPRPLQYGKMLQDVSQLRNKDSLEELREMIRRTGEKMEKQKKVLNGFISDVNDIQTLQRGFSSSEVALSNGTPKHVGTHLRHQFKLMVQQKPRARKQLTLHAPLKARDQPLRGVGSELAQSRSQPSLAAHAASPLALPARRAPPGAPGDVLDVDLEARRKQRQASRIGSQSGVPSSGSARLLDSKSRSASVPSGLTAERAHCYD
mmetsp:Transcript_33327/g.75986  ORF Transcript_33327/g.75986 Transcript_33327/m.75986 type:complete len:242 (-) Transcript_33327:31-756(-)